MANLPSAPNYITIEQTQMGSVATESLAQAIGQSNNWIVDNARSRPVGSIQYSTLTQAQFQAVIGTGWVLADGAALLITDQLRIITGLTTVPDMRGTFQRAIIGVEVITGATSLSVNPFHFHVPSVTSNVAAVAPALYANISGSPFLQGTVGWANPAYRPTGVISSVGGVEFRPKYAVVDIFMRIN